YLPAGEHVLTAFTRPLAQVRVLIVGQDPYPTPGHAMGLSFSVQPHVRPIPRSLVNIYKELEADLGFPPPPHEDLRAWVGGGVLPLSRSLTVRRGNPASHRGRGWDVITAAAIDALVRGEPPRVAILWGRAAQSPRPKLGAPPVVESPHPSPL